MRLRRLCLLILVFRFFLRDPIIKISFVPPSPESPGAPAGGDYRSPNHFIQGVFDDSFGSQFLELRDQFADLKLGQHHFDSHPAILGQSRNRRLSHRGQKLQDRIASIVGEVHFQSHHVPSRQCTLQKDRHSLDLGSFPGIFPTFLFRDKLGIALHELIDNSQIIGPEGGSGLGDIDDRIDEFGHFDLGRAPAELDLGIDSILLEIFFDDPDRFGRNAFPLEVFHRLNRGIVGNHEHPAGRIGSGPAVLEIADDMHIGTVLRDPVFSGNSTIEETMIDISTDLLGSDQTNLQFFVVDRGTIRT